VKWKAQVHWSFKGLETSWMWKGLVATCKLRVFRLSKHDSNLQPIVALSVTTHYSMVIAKVSRWITFTNENKWKCQLQAVGPQWSFSLKASGSKMHIA